MKYRQICAARNAAGKNPNLHISKIAHLPYFWFMVFETPEVESITFLIRI